MNSSPSYGAFSFPKLNGSPSRPYNVHTGVSGGGMNGGVGSGAGFMGFGPTGFTTPIDTVLDRFGRTGTIFPSVNNHHNGMNGGIPPNYGPGTAMLDYICTHTYLYRRRRGVVVATRAHILTVVGSSHTGTYIFVFRFL